MLEFDLNGLLIPAAAIKSTVIELEAEFSVKIDSGNRQELINQYKSYCADLKKLCGDVQLMQWVDGSFTTRYKNPADIDLLTFIDFGLVKKKEVELKEFIFPKSYENYQMDGYIIIDYPIDHKLYHTSIADRLYWT